MTEAVVHYSDWAQQPDIHLACGRWTLPAWETDDPPLFTGIYREERGGLYTFSQLDRVTCPECRGKIAHAGTI